MILWKEPLQLTQTVRDFLEALIEDGCVGGDWKLLSGLIREPATSAGQGTFILVGNFTI